MKHKHPDAHLKRFKPEEGWCATCRNVLRVFPSMFAHQRVIKGPDGQGPYCSSACVPSSERCHRTLGGSVVTDAFVERVFGGGESERVIVKLPPVAEHVVLPPEGF